MTLAHHMQRGVAPPIGVPRFVGVGTAHLQRLHRSLWEWWHRLVDTSENEGMRGREREVGKVVWQLRLIRRSGNDRPGGTPIDVVGGRTRRRRFGRRRNRIERPPAMLRVTAAAVVVRLVTEFHFFETVFTRSRETRGPTASYAYRHTTQSVTWDPIQS